MAEVSEVPAIPNLGTGILIPVITNRFSVTFPPSNSVISKEASNFLARQTLRCFTDYVNQTLYLEFEQPQVNGEMHDVLNSIIQAQRGTIVVSALAGDLEASHQVLYRNCRCIEHEYNLDYADNFAATHKLKFTFNGFITQNYSEINKSDQS